MSGKETTIALQIQDKGFRLHTLHAANEIRHAASYFEEIPPGDVNKDQLALAMRLVENNTNSFDPAQFSDRYQEALLEIIKAKIEGTQPVLVPQAEVGKVINLMDALRRSVAQSQPRKVVKRSAAASAKIGARQQRKLQSA
jgi:DNA end-binding protein Ku